MRASVQIENDVLLCPKCGENFLHHGEVRVYTRDIEDGPTQRVRIVQDLVGTRYDVDDNPSGRRGAVGILFRCENCEHDDGYWPPELVIIQHKGETYVQWRTGGEP